jgi:translation initiation factor IF-3
VIGENGDQIGIMQTPDAVRYAQERDLDLVEVAAEARPPVCRVLDYSKYKYEQAQKQKAARKHQTQITIREIKFRPKIAQHDYDTKKGHVVRFLRHKDKVKITIMFRGREVTHPERGTMILDRLAEELSELAVVEQRPNLDGRNMTMVLGPSKAVLAGSLDEGDGGDAKAEAEGADGPADGDTPAAGTNAADAPQPAEAAPAAETAEAPAAESAEADTAEAPAPDAAEVPTAESAEAEADSAEADSAEAPAPEESPQAPEADSTEAPAPESPQAPEADSTEAPAPEGAEAEPAAAPEKQKQS